MKKIIIIILFLFSIQITHAQFNTISWQTEELTIDGASFDWGTSFRYYDSKTRIRYNMSNDSNFIYFCFQPVDDFVKSQILRAGIQIEFSHKIKPKTTAIIEYPFPLEKDNKKMSNNSNTTFEAFFQSFQLFNNNYVSEGLYYTNGSQPLESEDGICIKFDKETNGLLCYEIRIPIKELYGENYILSTIAEKDLTVKLKVNSLTVKNKGQGPSHADMYVNHEMRSANRNTQNGRKSHQSSMYQAGNSFTINGKTLKHKLKLATKPE